VYSAHDTSEFGILSALNITTSDCISRLIRKEIAYDGYNCPLMKFASNLVIEIFKENYGLNSVRLAYNDKYYDVC